jgi:hypothetical protein
MWEKFQEGEYYYYGRDISISGSNQIKTGNVKMKFDKSTNPGKAIIQSSFDDGKFYEKEKFFVNIPLQFSSTSNTYCLAPFDDRILLVSIYNGSINALVGVFSKYPFDYNAHKYVHDWHNSYCLLETTSEKWWCETELESSYDKNKDKYAFFSVINQIYAAYAGK